MLVNRKPRNPRLRARKPVRHSDLIEEEVLDSFSSAWTALLSLARTDQERNLLVDTLHRLRTRMLGLIREARNA